MSRSEADENESIVAEPSNEDNDEVKELKEGLITLKNKEIEPIGTLLILNLYLLLPLTYYILQT